MWSISCWNNSRFLVFSFILVCILLNFSYRNFNIFPSIAVVFMHLILHNSGVNRNFTIAYTAWKVSKYGLFSDTYSAQRMENTEQKKTPYLENFHALLESLICQKFILPFSFHIIFYVTSVWKQYSVFRYFRLFSHNN